MEIICVDKQTFEELRVRFCEFEDRVTRLCRPVEDLGLKNWLDNQEVCLLLKVSPRTLQTLRDNGTLAYTQICHKTYYKPGDVEKLMAYVGIRHKEKEVRERRKNGNL